MHHSISTKKLTSSVLLLLTLIVLPLASFANTNGDADWQPVSSEKLIRMPAKYMDVSVEKNFQQSSLASGIQALDAQIQLEATRMQEAHQGLEGVDGEQTVALRHQFLMAKSQYLELMHEKHQLAELALNKKADIYQRVLQKMQNNKAIASDPIRAELVARQQGARARLTKTVGQVDQLLAQTLSDQPSKYQQEYSVNLAKVERLKQAIQQHSANETPMLEGQSLNREQYVRYLLSHIDSDLALLDQERLMLGYMAKLVALDAQALEHEITYSTPDKQIDQVKDQLRLVNNADLFMNL